jgi:hypothetical protein
MTAQTNLSFENYYNKREYGHDASSTITNQNNNLNTLSINDRKIRDRAQIEHFRARYVFVKVTCHCYGVMASTWL